MFKAYEGRKAAADATEDVQSKPFRASGGTQYPRELSSVHLNANTAIVENLHNFDASICHQSAPLLLL